jgi:hypothetical protein
MPAAAGPRDAAATRTEAHHAPHTLSNRGRRSRGPRMRVRRRLRPGGAALSASSPGSANSDWAQRASTICENALPDDSHQLVNHFDARHIKRHGMAIVDAGSKLDALGAPPGGDAGAYGRMIELYKRSVIYHGLALRDLAKGNDGNAAAEYAIGLDLANKADGLAMGFGAESCDRFGMGG